MKTMKFHKIMAAAAVLGATVLGTSCSDTWNEHYDPSTSQVGEGTLLSHIANDPQLANFYKVISNIGGSDMLNSPQAFTVWAPVNLTAAQADSVIAVYNADKAAGIKQDDNKAITQFLQNHVALYSRPISSLTDDTVKMLSLKYMTLKGTSNETGTLNGIPFNGMELCNNGIIYKSQEVMTFYPNIRQYVEQNADMTALSKFFKSFDKYELNESASVPGEIVNGKQEYLDSVTTLSNILLASYGYIQREDSSYTFIAPTNDVWDKLYERYKKYYVYNNSVNNPDSLQDINASLRIIEGRFFNMSKYSAYNKHPKDSLCNTHYLQLQQHYPRQNVFYTPEEGLFAGMKQQPCSNGTVYIDKNGAIDPAATFFSRKDYEASSPIYYEIPTNANNEQTMNVSSMTLTLYKDSAMTERDQEFRFAQVTSKTSSAQTELEYKLPNTLSGCYYNIYLVTVPNTNGLPSWFTMQYQTPKEDGSWPTSFTYLNNPDPITENSPVANTDVILSQSNNQRYFVASENKVDTILIQSAVQFPYSGYGTNEGQVKLKISSVGPSNSKYREKIYTRTLRLCEFILVPFDTEIEAEEAKYELDAFNDRILQETYKN